jgi:hypothetical protein
VASTMIIARPDAANPTQYLGVYVHSNGMPTAGGKILFAQVVTRFKGDVEAALKYYIDEHPTGWSYLSEAFGQNECYCHDHGEGTAETAYHGPEHEQGNDWTYILWPAKGLEIRRFDYGRVALVPWDQERVDWEGIEQRAYAMSGNV